MRNKGGAGGKDGHEHLEHKMVGASDGHGHLNIRTVVCHQNTNEEGYKHIDKFESLVVIQGTSCLSMCESSEPSNHSVFPYQRTIVCSPYNK